MQSIGQAMIDGFMRLEVKPKPIFAQFLSDHGRVMPVSPEHADNPYMGQLKMCYRNSALAVLTIGTTSNDGLYYCEGYAATKALGFPIEHAWLCDGRGRVIDPTWKEPGIDYFGVAFKREFLRSHLLKTEQYGILGALYLLPDKLRKHSECLRYLESGLQDLNYENANAG